MTPITDLITGFPLFGVCLTLLAFYIGQIIYQRSGNFALFQPVVTGLLLVIACLIIFDIPYSRYYSSSLVLHSLLGPATVALAIPLFQNAKRIRELFLPSLCTVLVGGTLTIIIALAVLWMFDASSITMLSMAPKSITTPIAMIVSEHIGGLPALSALFVLVTGAIGAMVGIPILNAINIEDDGVKGFTMGLTSHAIGTARSLEESPECAAFTALAMGLTGVATALLLPVAVALLI